jgi:rhodanese-related sulfurtransferase
MKTFIILSSAVLFIISIITACSKDSRSEFSSWITVSEIDALIKNVNPQIVDIRTPAEFRNGYIAGAANLPLADLASSMDSLDKKRPLLIYCNTVNRVKRSLDIFGSAGFEKVYIINGGYVALKAAGYPLVTE